MDDVQRVVERAVRSLAVRAHSEHEIVEKLKRAGFEETAIAAAMAKLVQHKLIDDEAFARHWAESRARGGMGQWRISQELRHKGVQRELIDLALAELNEEDSMELAVELALKHLRKGDKNARKRAYDAMIRRGYGFDMARDAMEVALGQLTEEAEWDDS